MFNQPSFNSDKLGNNFEKNNDQMSKAIQVSQLVTGGVLNVLNIGKNPKLSEKFEAVTQKIDSIKKSEKYKVAVKTVSQAAMIASVGIQGVNLGHQMTNFQTSTPKPMTSLASEKNYQKRKKIVEKTQKVIEISATNQNSQNE